MARLNVKYSVVKSRNRIVKQKFSVGNVKDTPPLHFAGVTFTAASSCRKQNNLTYYYICYSLDTTLYRKSSYTDTL